MKNNILLVFPFDQVRKFAVFFRGNLPYSTHAAG